MFTAQEIRAKEEKLHKEHQSEKKKLLQKGMDQKQKENNFREVERGNSVSILSYLLTVSTLA